MRLECSVQVGDDCALQGGGLSGHRIPLKVAVTLPGNFTEHSGNRVISKALSLDSNGSGVFKSAIYREHVPGSLQFEVQKEAVGEMVKFAGSLYQGTVTILWESMF